MFQDYNNMFNPLYGNFDQSMRAMERQQTGEEIISFNQALSLIRQSVSDERSDEVFYDVLISQAPSEKEKEIIRSIRDDERRHNQILRRIYCEFTGQMLPTDTSISGSENTLDYQTNLEKALFGELDAVVKYRRILGAMPSGNTYTCVFSILTDEIRHACKYNFLIS